VTRYLFTIETPRVTRYPTNEGPISYRVSLGDRLHSVIARESKTRPFILPSELGLDATYTQNSNQKSGSYHYRQGEAYFQDD
jgi:hypothetical protein